jgi:pyrimidine-nucleoside phosphorylase
MLELGAGRLRKEDAIDHAAGLVIEAQVGDLVPAGAVLARVHAQSQGLVETVRGRLSAAWRFSPEPVQRPAHVLARVDSTTLAGR